MNLISIFRRLFLPLVVLLLAATAGAQSAYDEIKAVKESQMADR